MIKKWILLILVIFASSQTLGKGLVEIRLPNIPKAEHNLIQESRLFKQKEAQNRGHWGQCLNWALKNYNQFLELRPWIALSWLECATEEAIKTQKPRVLEEVLKKIEGTPSYMLSGIWGENIYNQYLQSQIQLLDIYPRTEKQKLDALIEKLILVEKKLNADQKAKLYFVAAERAQMEARLGVAEQYLRKSLDYKDSPLAQDKLKGVLFALNANRVEEKTKEIIMPLTSAELSFHKRMEASLSASDWISFIEDAVEYLNKYPNGHRAEFADRKIFEVYGALPMDAPREKALKIMAKISADRASDWSAALHRRSDWQGSLVLAESALDSLQKSKSAARLHYIAGRSAQFLGEYKKSREHFGAYADFHAGAEDIAEVLFRLGLVHLRLEQGHSALAVFERLLVLPNKHPYELSARYWMTRVLQKSSPDRATAEKEYILQHMPFSFYALKLAAESNKNILTWPAKGPFKKPKNSIVYMATAHADALKRIELLGSHGWYAEASAEILNLPDFEDPQIQQLMAQRWVQAGVYTSAIKLLIQSGDLEPGFRSSENIKTIFPKVYEKEIKTASEQFGLSEGLIRSLMRQESAFNPLAVSRSKAIGLMQLIPPTADEVANELGKRNVEIPTDVFLPEINIPFGSYYLSKMIKNFQGNVPLAIAAYNAGPTRMKQFVNARKEVQSLLEPGSGQNDFTELWMDEIPWFETSFYVKAVLRNTLIYKMLESAPKAGPKPLDLKADFWREFVNLPIQK